MSGFDRLHPSLQHHIVNTLGWPSLRPLQDEAIEPIGVGDHALLLAPTAGGKTEAAVFPLLSAIATERRRPTSVLYLAPLKALLNNLEPRLEKYCNFTGHRAAVWHGDIGPSPRERIVSDPPDILLTTPESLEAMLMSTRVEAKVFFENLRTVVIDELHAFASDDRGWHMLAVLERLGRLSGRQLQRVGLSATVGNPDELLEWLTSTCDGERRIVAPEAEAISAGTDVTLDWVGSLGNAARVIASMHRGEKRLVFVDSRARAEDLTAQLRDLDVTVFLSHGSLGRTERHQTEQAFSQSQNCVIVATSTLELGIDIGDLDRVIQIDAPSTVASFLQRLGRTGRRPGSLRNALFLVTREEQFLQAVGLLRAWSDGFVEPVHAPPFPAHLLAQQLMALVLQEHGAGRTEWIRWLGEPHVFGEEVAAVADQIVEHMLATEMLVADGSILGFGETGETTFGRRHFMDLTSAFTSEPVLKVRAGRQEIGLIPDIALTAADANEGLLLLAGRHWHVSSVDWKRRVVQVEPAPGGGKIRFWGDGQPTGYEICQATRRVLCGTEPGPALSDRALDKLAETRAEFSWLGETGTPVVRDDTGRAVWWTFAGLRANLELAARIGHLAAKTPSNLSMVVEAEATETELLEMCRALGPDEQAVTPPKGMIEGLKFRQALPPALALDVARRRLADPYALAAVLAAFSEEPSPGKGPPST